MSTKPALGERIADELHDSLIYNPENPKPCPWRSDAAKEWFGWPIDKVSEDKPKKRRWWKIW